MEEQKVIKIIVPSMCPHCSKEIMMAHRIFTPIIEWVLKREDLDRAKNKVKVEMEKMDISADEKGEMLKWLNDEQTLFGPAEVQGIIKQLKDQSSKPSL